MLHLCFTLPACLREHVLRKRDNVYIDMNIESTFAYERERERKRESEKDSKKISKLSNATNLHDDVRVHD